MNRDLDAELEALESLLADTLGVDDFFDFNSLKVAPARLIWQHTFREVPGTPPDPKAFAPAEASGLGKVFGKAKHQEDWTRDATVERVRRLYEFRQRRFKIRAGKLEDEDGMEEGSLLYQRMMHEIYDAQRQALVGLRNSREISSDVMRRVERELDLEESRLEV